MSVIAAPGPVTFDVELPRPRTDVLRVLQVVEAFGGGVFHQLRGLTARLGQRGIHSAVAFGRRPETPETPRADFADEVELFEVAWGGRRLRQSVDAAVQLRRLYASWRPDVIHLHSSFAGVTGALIRPPGVPCVYTPHGYSFLQTGANRIASKLFVAAEKVTAARVDLIGAVSESEAFAARRVTSPTKIRLVRNGIPELESPVAFPKARRARPLVVAMGRISDARSHVRAAEILKAVSDVADVKWVGDAVDPGYRADVEHAGIPVTGWLAHDEAVRQLGQADVYLHCAAWDGQPLSVLEAMAVGTAVVGTDIEPLRELLSAEQRFRTTQDAIDLIRRLLTEDAQLEAALISQSEKRGRYSAAEMADGWAAVYHDLSGSRANTPIRSLS